MGSLGHLLCLGYGYIAKAVAPSLLADGWSIGGTTRSFDKAFALKSDHIEPILLATNQLERHHVQQTTHLLISIKPNSSTCFALDLIRPHLASLSLKGIIYLSSTSVYGDHEGGWVDETTPAHPDTPRGQHRLAAEHLWIDAAEEHDIPLQILRLAGIYGPGRNAINTLHRRANENNPLLSQRIDKTGQFFNRIHVADITATIHKSLSQPTYNSTLLNLSDDLPSPPRDVIEYASHLTGLKLPPLISIEDATLSPMARSFYANSKRLKNDRLKAFLDGSLQYPTYREGLEMIAQQAGYANK